MLAAGFFVAGLVALGFGAHHVAAGNFLRGTHVSGDHFFALLFPSLVLATALIWSHS